MHAFAGDPRPLRSRWFEVTIIACLTAVEYALTNIYNCGPQPQGPGLLSPVPWVQSNRPPPPVGA